MSKNKKIIILIFSVLILITALVVLVFFILNRSIQNKDNYNTVSFSRGLDLISYSTSPIGANKPTEQNYIQITNYTSGGSSFYCPKNPTICQKIQNYYSNINSKNFAEAYKYGNKIESYNSLVSSSKNYLFISASYIKEQSDNKYISYVTIINNNKELELYNVLIDSDENSILSLTPTLIGNKFNLDCSYIDLNNKNVCVFKTQFTNEIANLIANSFFYKPEYYKGVDLNQNETVFYTYGADALDSWAIVYKYNHQTKVLSFIDWIHYKDFPDIDNICTGNKNIDISIGGCIEKYLNIQEIENNRRYIEVATTYKLNI